jgi:hypothetical protein
VLHQKSKSTLHFKDPIPEVGNEFLFRIDREELLTIIRRHRHVANHGMFLLFLTIREPVYKTNPRQRRGFVFEGLTLLADLSARNNEHV